jgi:putative hydrolase of the HAD superfamily
VADIEALVVDYGGVLTSSLYDTMRAWCDSDEIDPDVFASVIGDWLGPSYGDEAAVNPAHALERGEMDVPDFERELAGRLRTTSGRPVQAEGLLTRMFAGFREHRPMVEVVRRVRSAGLKTALLSNSWGLDYDRAEWDVLFDVVVISGEVQMRKPEPEIFRHTARKLGVEPARCVFVDDLAPNVRGAAAVGMVGVQHVDPERTIGELEALLRIPLREAVA